MWLTAALRDPQNPEACGRTPASVALAWVAQRPGVTSVIVGPRKAQQLTANIEALETDFPDAAMVELEAGSRHTVLLPVNGAQDPHASEQLF